MTPEEYEKIVSERVERIKKEFATSFELLKAYPRSVTVLGSARFAEDNIYYQKARELGEKVAKELDYAIITGGGGGIMEAANRGAYEAGGKSVGLNIILPREQQNNLYETDSMMFRYFFSRKVALSFGAESYVFFPGGYGTLNEFFEIITLVQTKKIPGVPLILFGKDYWSHLDEFIRTVIFKNNGAISPSDLELYTITDDIDEIIKIIKKVSPRNVVTSSR